MPHAMGGFGLTPNVLAQSTTKATMGARFLGLLGSWPLDEQKIWLPNQSVQDPQTWLAPNLLHLKQVYEVLLTEFDCKEQDSYVVQDQPLLHLTFSSYRHFRAFVRFICGIRRCLSRGIPAR
jgi:hypothetical protein